MSAAKKLQSRRRTWGQRSSSRPTFQWDADKEAEKASEEPDRKAKQKMRFWPSCRPCENEAVEDSMWTPAGDLNALWCEAVAKRLLL